MGAGLDLLTWLERYIFPLERSFDVATADLIAPAAFRAFARAGTTTVVAYGALWAQSLDACFRAAEAHGIRAVIGKVMMDRLSYDTDRDPSEVLELSLRQSVELCEAWNGRDDGRLMYAFTPRFAVSCSAPMLAASANAAAEAGAYWQTHLSEDRGEIAEVRRLFPDAVDYTDVYDRAGGLTSRAILAHAIHLSDREVARLAESGRGDRALPELEPLPGERRDAAGALPCGRDPDRARLGRGRGAGCAALLVMRAGAYTQNALRAAGLSDAPPLSPADWLRLGTLGGAEALGLGGSDRVGRGRQGGRPDRRRPLGDAAARGGRGARRRPPGRDAEPAHLPCASGHGARRVGARAGCCRPDTLAAMKTDRILQILINAGALYVAVYLLDGITFVGEWWKLLLVALAFSLLNTYLRPILRILTFPITIVTMGIFLLVINAAMLLLTSAISDGLKLGFHVADFGAAFLGAIVVAIVGWILSMFVGVGRLPTRAL